MTEMNKQQTCHDCDCKEGEYHEPGCDMERCPFCGGQLISCVCRYEQLGFNIDRNLLPYHGLPQDIYENGLTVELTEKWEMILNEKGYIPYIRYPVLCVKCGVLWPEFFHVPDEEWEHYIEPAMRGKVICWDCYCEIKQLIDEAQND